MFLNLPGLHVLIQKLTYLQNVFPQWQKFKLQLKMIVDDSIIPLHEFYNDKSLCHFDASKSRPFINATFSALSRSKRSNLHTNFISSKYGHSFFTVKHVNKTFISKKIGNVLLSVLKPRLTERKDSNKRTSL